MKKADLSIKRLKLEDYEIMRTLGKGGFGKVKLSKNKKTGKYYALKLLNKG
jgi:serine/threonine protein kinase